MFLIRFCTYCGKPD